MPFSPSAYGPSVAALLALDGDGDRLMPLAGGTCCSSEALARLRKSDCRSLFSGARAPEAALAGLYLYFSCLDECHRIAQSLETREGSYWHAIMHRQEPDPGNSGYWFRRVGDHPIFPYLRTAAEALGFATGKGRWDPFDFIDYCEQARLRPGSGEERIALELQRQEWQLLFAWCADPAANRDL